MKSTTIVAISLILFALVIILSAAFLFESVNRGQYKATHEAIRANQQDEIDELSLLKENARSDARKAQDNITAVVSDLQAHLGTSTAVFSDMSEKQAAAVGTREAQIATISALEADKLELDSQVNQYAQDLDSRTEELSTAIAERDLTREFFENQKPQILITKPDEVPKKIELGETIEFFVIASHPLEVKDVTMFVADPRGPELECVDVEQDIQVATTCTWKPDEVGIFTLQADATDSNNNQGFIAIPHITIEVVDEEIQIPEGDETSESDGTPEG